jgi:WD repeat-containing protein 23
MSVGTRSGQRITVVPDYEEDVEDDDGDVEYMDEDDEPPIRTNQWIPPHKEPQKAGLDLLGSGEFGRVDVKNRARRDPPSRNVSRRVLNGFAHPVPVHNREAVQAVGAVLFQTRTISSYQFFYYQNLVPNTNGVTVASYESNMYTAQFSDGKYQNPVWTVPF